MAAILAIAQTTIRGSLRSRVVHVLLALLLAVTLLPVILRGDGTLHGQLQLSLTYSLGMVGAVLSLVTVWLGCTQISLDIESHRIHLILTKPVPVLTLWLGKLLGIMAIQIVLLSVSAATILALTHWKLSQAENKAELAELKANVLTGRRVFDTDRPSLDELVKQEYRRRLHEGLIDTRLPEVAQLSTLQRELKGHLDEIPFSMTREWVIKGLPQLGPDEIVHLRYRIYRAQVKSRVRERTEGVWHVKEATSKRFVSQPRDAMSGVFLELPISGKFISEDGELKVAYTNFDPEQRVAIIQHIDGPSALLPAVSFANNYTRAVLLVLLHVVAIAAFSCALGGAFSTGAAAFLVCAYLALGALVDFQTPAKGEMDVPGGDAISQIQYQVRRGVRFITVGANEFSGISSLSHGRLIELSYIFTVAVKLLLIRALPVSLVGLLLLRQRELGAVLRP